MRRKVCYEYVELAKLPKILFTRNNVSNSLTNIKHFILLSKCIPFFDCVVFLSSLYGDVRYDAIEWG